MTVRRTSRGSSGLKAAFAAGKISERRDRVKSSTRGKASRPAIVAARGALLGEAREEANEHRQADEDGRDA